MLDPEKVRFALDHWATQTKIGSFETFLLCLAGRSWQNKNKQHQEVKIEDEENVNREIKEPLARRNMEYMFAAVFQNPPSVVFTNSAKWPVIILKRPEALFCKCPFGDGWEFLATIPALYMGQNLVFAPPGLSNRKSCILRKQIDLICFYRLKPLPLPNKQIYPLLDFSFNFDQIFKD